MEPQIQVLKAGRMAMAAGERVVELLVATSGQKGHQACGVTARPCRDCRKVALLECVDQESCGITDFCRPCAATWRWRIWRVNHTRHVREFQRAVERFPALANLHADQATAAAVWRELRLALRWDAIKWLGRQSANRSGARRMANAMGQHSRID